MEDFIPFVKEVIDAPPFNGSRRLFADTTALNETHLCRLLAGDRGFSPQIVGKIAGGLPGVKARRLIKAYLRLVAAEIKEEQEKWAAVK